MGLVFKVSCRFGVVVAGFVAGGGGRKGGFGITMGALILRIGFWGPLYYIHANNEP